MATARHPAGALLPVELRGAYLLLTPVGGGALLEERVRLSEEEVESLLASVRIIALRKVGDMQVAEEVAQETLTRTLHAAEVGRLEDKRSLAPYVRAIASNVIADIYRTSSRVVSLESLPGQDVPRSKQNPLRELMSEQERQRVRDALAYLSPQDREILRLCYYDGLPPKEIAARQGEPAPRIWKRKSRALERLRSAYRALEAGGQVAGSSSTMKAGGESTDD